MRDGIRYAKWRIRSGKKRSAEVVEGDDARRKCEPIPSHLPPDIHVSNVPEGLIRIFDLDLVAAGLAKRIKKDGKWVIDKRDDRWQSGPRR